MCINTKVRDEILGVPTSTWVDMKISVSKNINGQLIRKDRTIIDRIMESHIHLAPVYLIAGPCGYIAQFKLTIGTNIASVSNRYMVHTRTSPLVQIVGTKRPCHKQRVAAYSTVTEVAILNTRIVGLASYQILGHIVPKNTVGYLG
jgi:hypothetical protein